MKITHNKVGQNLNISDTSKTDKAGKADGVGVGPSKDLGKTLEEMGASKVELSPRAQEMKKIKEAAMATPDINEEKVARLQKLIDAGEYKVDAKDIADKMVDEQLMWS